MDQDLRSRIKAAAQERGIDPEIAVNFAQAESSLNPNAKAKTSSASGLFQVINKTWKEYGGGDKKDIDEQIRVGADIIASNQQKFKRKFNSNIIKSKSLNVKSPKCKY
jgi:soluble lytic murein transglycosylase-like protein